MLAAEKRRVMDPGMKTNWARAAEMLAVRFPRAALHPAVMVWAGEKSRATRGGWAVAFSGGADSLALLLLLWAHFPERRDRLIALHFNHRLRGRAADADAVFCRRVAAALGVSFRSGRWHRPVQGAGEAEARAARLTFFEREQRRARAPALWLGHQQDDIAESMLMRLARGSGTAGLAAPRPVGPMPAGRVHLRPLLTLKKGDLTTALRAVRVVWREDASNAGDDFFRNRVRRAVVPAWRRAAERDVLAGAALARERLEEDDVALEAWVDSLLPTEMPSAPRSRAHGLDLTLLAGAPRAVVRRALHRWLLAQPNTGDLSRQGFEQLLGAVKRGAATRFSLGPSGFAVIRRGRLLHETGVTKRSTRRKQTRGGN